MATKIAMHQVQMAGKLQLIDQIDNDVKLTRNVMIQLFHTVETLGLRKVPSHNKCVNIIIEPTPVNSQGNEVYTLCQVMTFWELGPDEWD